MYISVSVFFCCIFEFIGFLVPFDVCEYIAAEALPIPSCSLGSWLYFLTVASIVQAGLAGYLLALIGILLFFDVCVQTAAGAIWQNRRVHWRLQSLTFVCIAQAWLSINFPPSMLVAIACPVLRGLWHHPRAREKHDAPQRYSKSSRATA